ncbi:MAG: cysteine hydrolase family protein [Candidatus Bathyarchaeia archaeon]
MRHMENKSAIIVIDMLNDFIHGALKLDRAKRIIPNIRKLIERARKNGVPIIYTSDAHVPGIDKELELWGQHALDGTEGAQVINELKPREGDYTIKKRRYSAFFATDLDVLLRELEVVSLVLVGIHTHICVLHTAVDAFYRGYAITVPEDCVEAATEEDHKRAVDQMKSLYGAKIVRSSELFQEGHRG